MSEVLLAAAADGPHESLTPTASQRSTIEAELGPVLVLAGPGAGKTFCLVERIRFLIDNFRIAPADICAFTFTNKAAEEIATRLERDLGEPGQRVRCGTIHSLCAELLREYCDQAGLPRGFGIADEEYQGRVLARFGVPARYHTSTLRTFSLHRLRGVPLLRREEQRFEKYTRYLAKRQMVDFDGLVIMARQLLERNADVAAGVRARWSYVLVDEFQDLNPAQYAVVRELAREHRNVFAVGDVEQSIFSWTGADPKLFREFVNNFAISRIYALEENHRCPRETFALARRLVEMNVAELGDHPRIRAERRSDFPVRAVQFDHDGEETEWLIADLRADVEAYGLRWDDFALLYRKHEVGNALEANLVTAGIPCRLAHGRALSDNPVVAYLVAALRVIASPADRIPQELFLKVVLPHAQWAGLQSRADANRESVLRQILWEARRMRRHDDEVRKLRRGLFALKNLEALGRRHSLLEELVNDLLSQRVGEYRSILEERHHELSDPLDVPDVKRLGDRLASALDEARSIWIESMPAALPLRRMIEEMGFARVLVGGEMPAGAEPLRRGDGGALGIALGTFKALQAAASRRHGTALRDFTALDLETTERNRESAEIVSMAAVRVRQGQIVAEYETLVRPRVPITAGATAVHGITNEMVAPARAFGDVWPQFRAFCGDDIVVAHNGTLFDFPILRRMARGLEGHFLCTYDTLVLARELHSGSRTLANLAAHYEIPLLHAHDALSDTKALAAVCLRLEDDRLKRARKTSLVNLLDHLGIALALDEAAVGEEVEQFREVTRFYSLGRYGEALETYRADRANAADPSLPPVDEVIERLGGAQFMARLRTEKGADDRYPAAMARIRRLLPHGDGASLDEQVSLFLERVALSARSEGTAIGRGRVNLLTLHSTKGLEFSRVYIVGVEDAELLGGSPMRPVTELEVEEGRRVLYVGMTRAKDRVVLTRSAVRSGKPTGGHQFLSEMGLTLQAPDK